MSGTAQPPVKIKWKGMWIQEGTEWKKLELKEVPDKIEYPSIDVCFCRVSDGFIACGGKINVDEPADSRGYHFSVVTKGWKSLANMLTPRMAASAVEYANMKVLMVGGMAGYKNDLASCEILDCETKKWHSSGNMPKPLLRPLVAAASGNVYILPRDKDLKHTRLLEYDPSISSEHNKHKYKAKLPDDVTSTKAGCLVSDAENVNRLRKLFLLGGSQLALEYCLETNQWNKLRVPSLYIDGYFGCCAAVTAGMVMVYGGSKTTLMELRMVEAYNISTGKWKTLEQRLPYIYVYRNDIIAQFMIKSDKPTESKSKPITIMAEIGR